MSLYFHRKTLFAFRSVGILEAKAAVNVCGSEKAASCQKRKNHPIGWLKAEREGFEPPEACTSTVFKTAALDRSAISPGAKVTDLAGSGNSCRKNKTAGKHGTVGGFGLSGRYYFPACPICGFLSGALRCALARVSRLASSMQALISKPNKMMNDNRKNHSIRPITVPMEP